MNSKKIVIAGGSGTLGRLIAAHFSEKGFAVIVLTRTSAKEDGVVKYIHWDAKTHVDDWVQHLDGAEAVINLTGSSINVRFTDKNKKTILASRINATNALGYAIQRLKNPPKTWMNASAVGIYKKHEHPQTEESTPATDFMGTVCAEWEKSFFLHTTTSTRKIALRIGIMLTPTGGILEPLLKITKLGLGGKAGTGKQYISWLHYKDLIGIIDFMLQKETIEGVVNCTSPNPVTNKAFMESLRASLQIPFGLPNPTLALKIGSWLMNTEADLVLKGSNIIPQVLLNNNFQFRFASLLNALKDLKKQTPS
ncbi:MAG: TIGR01777 family oxidoreductase [Bacteroidetes bacterium]|nr:TIGR01777 family oxidoreductase [Bacteroidota bacterium]